MQQSLLAGVDLTAQVGDVGLDDVDVTAEVVTPHVVEDLRLRQDRACVDDEVAQQGELGRRQRHRFAGLPDLVGVLVELDVSEGQPRRAGLLDTCAGAAQHHPQPGDHLFEAERLRDIVIAAERQTGDLVLQRIARGQEQGGGLDAVGAQPAEQPEPVHPGHHHVEDDRVRTDLTRLVQGGGAVGRGVDLESLELQTHGEQLDDVGLVVDH